MKMSVPFISTKDVLANIEQHHLQYTQYHLPTFDYPANYIETAFENVMLNNYVLRDVVLGSLSD